MEQKSENGIVELMSYKSIALTEKIIESSLNIITLVIFSFKKQCSDPSF